MSKGERAAKQEKEPLLAFLYIEKVCDASPRAQRGKDAQSGGRKAADRRKGKM